MRDPWWRIAPASCSTYAHPDQAPLTSLPLGQRCPCKCEHFGAFVHEAHRGFGLFADSLQIDDHTLAEHWMHHVVADGKIVRHVRFAARRAKGLACRRGHAATTPAKVRYRRARPVGLFAQMTATLIRSSVDTALAIEKVDGNFIEEP